EGGGCGAPGAVCGSAQGGRCKGDGCVPTFLVLRVGDGVAALSTAAAPVFVERRYFDSVGDLVPAAGNPIALPLVAAGANQPLTLSGTTTRDGVLSLSSDGRYATLLGYGTAVGTATVATSRSATVNRIVGRIDGNDRVDTSTRLANAFDGNNARSA